MKYLVVGIVCALLGASVVGFAIADNGPTANTSANTKSLIKDVKREVNSLDSELDTISSRLTSQGYVSDHARQTSLDSHDRGLDSHDSSMDRGIDRLESDHRIICDELGRFC